MVVVGGYKSFPADVKSGVAQGTVLGSVVFIIYVIDMIYALKKSNALSSFADDTKLVKAIIAALCQCFPQEDLNQVVLWYAAKNMLLH